MHISLDSALGRPPRLIGESINSIAVPAAAYSLRSLTGGDPEVVNVRRSTGGEEKFTASEISSGALVAYVGSGNDGFVETWYDQSGNGKNATQTDTDKQPKIVSSGSLIVDSAGLPEIDFDGSDDRLEIDFGSNLSQPNSILFVHQSDLTGDTNNEFFDELGGSVRTLFDTGSNKYRPFAGVVTDSGVSIDTNKNLVFAFYEGSSSRMSKNGTVTSAINIGTNAIAQTSAIGFSEGTGNNYNGTMQEFIVYNSNQVSNRTKIETNIMNYYSIS